MYNKRIIGKEQEDAATNYLIQNGYRIIEHNFFSRTGEIDLIGWHQGYLVFIEVKYRKNKSYGYPEEAISRRKMHAIYQTAMYYLLSHGYTETTPCRFDVVVILGNDIRVIQNAFQLGDFY